MSPFTSAIAVVEAHAAHLLRLLRGGDVEDAILEGLQRRRVAIEAGHPDVMIGVGDLNRLRRAERQRIGLPEDDARLRVRLQQVGGQLEAFVLVPAFAPEFADDLDVGIVLECDAAAFRPVDFGGRALLSVDDQHFTLAAGLLRDPVADLASRIRRCRSR